MLLSRAEVRDGLVLAFNVWNKKKRDRLREHVRRGTPVLVGKAAVAYHHAGVG